MNQKAAPGNRLSVLPPRIPDDKEKMERAILLLGNRTKEDLKTKSRLELEKLIGFYPNQQQAVMWKQSLKQIKKEREERNQRNDLSTTSQE